MPNQFVINGVVINGQLQPVVLPQDADHIICIPFEDRLMIVCEEDRINFLDSDEQYIMVPAEPRVSFIPKKSKSECR